MSSVSEWIVREYLETLGYLVTQPCKHHVGGRPKQGEEGIGLLAVNPSVSEQRVPNAMLWTAEEFTGIARAVVGVCGWHTERIYIAKLDHDPEMLGFISKESLRMAARKFGSTAMAKIICLPKLPVSKQLRQEMLTMLRQKGIDGVLLFRTMLLELINRADAHRNYEKSDLLQIIRILKNYDLLKDYQMDLFQPEKKTRGI